VSSIKSAIAPIQKRAKELGIKLSYSKMADAICKVIYSRPLSPCIAAENSGCPPEASEATPERIAAVALEYGISEDLFRDLFTIPQAPKGAPHGMTKAAYPDHEARASRGDLVDALCRRLSSLDSNPTHLLRDRSMYAPKKPAPVTIRRIWAFGSAVRGGEDCGDLDLLVQIDGRALRPTVERAFFRHPRIKIILGCPGQNELDLDSKETVLVWEDGKANGEAIHKIRQGIAQIEAPAGRMPRLTDGLVFRLDQIGLPPEDALILCELCAAGFLRADFVPLSALPPPDFAKLDASLAPDGRLAPKGDGIRLLLAHLLSYADSQPSSPIEEHRGLVRDSGRYTYGRFRFLPDRAVSCLNWINGNYGGEMLFMPRLTRRGPNGILHVSRTERHPWVAGLPDGSVVRWRSQPFRMRLDPSFTIASVFPFGDVKDAHFYGDASMIASRVDLARILDALVQVNVASPDGSLPSFFLHASDYGTQSPAKIFGPSPDYDDAAHRMAIALEASIERRRAEDAAHASMIRELMFADRGRTLLPGPVTLS
jgi:hypothetical protein